jgi:putative ABC transport system substrate-binding protein
LPFDQFRRRDFITLLGGAAFAWPLAARAQQGERVRRIGVLMSLVESDPEGQARVAPLRQGLQELGWIEGRNVRIEFRWAGGDADSARAYAAELISLAPDVIVGNSSLVMAALQRQTRTIPIVFVQVIDPVGAGFVTSLARPGGNITGFTTYEYAISGKWLELLKEVAPKIVRVGVLRDPALAAGAGQLGAIHAVAPSFGVEIRPIGVREAGEIEQAIAAFAGGANGGLIVLPGALATVHRELIIGLAAGHRLPAVYGPRFFATSGGLISYGADTIQMWRRSASYLDRILKGEKPAELPVQAPTKYELVINLKTAKALGLTVPDTLLARADEVIE